MISVKFADWEICCQLPMTGSQAGGGLHIMAALFRNRGVLERGSQPFAIVPYHDRRGPFFKDGLGPQGGGVPYLPLKPDAPNAGDWDLPPDAIANNEAEALVVEKEPATATAPASVAVWAKFQVGNYQYIHRWEFRADGVIEPGVGLGGPLFGSQPAIARNRRESERLRSLSHVHNFYFRLDFAFGKRGNQVVEQQEHTPQFPLIFLSGVDTWQPIAFESKRTFDGRSYTRWRIRHRTQRNGNLQPISYEIVPGSPDPPDGVFSTADFFVHRRAGFHAQLGAEVGNTDHHIMNGYGFPVFFGGFGGFLGTSDVIIWYVLREHHRPAPLGEERITLPYHFDHFTIRPRDFLNNTPTSLYATRPPSP